MNSNVVKPDKFHRLHLVYRFTVPLNHFLSMQESENLTPFTPLSLLGKLNF